MPSFLSRVPRSPRRAIARRLLGHRALGHRSPVRRSPGRRSAGRRSLDHRIEPTIAVLGALVLIALFARAVLPNSDFALAGGRFGSGPPRDAERTSVVDVVDGDTVVVDGGRHVRVLGIDTPETVHPDLDGPQPFGLEASARLSELVDGRRVALESDLTDADHYGRSLRHVWIGRRLAAEVLIREGLGHALIIPPNTRHADRLREAERNAREADRGLWSMPRPESPDIFETPWAAGPGTSVDSR